MALRMAAESSNRYAAVAAANPNPIFAFPPNQPISILLMNGTEDRILPYDGGQMIRKRGRVFSADDTIKYWVRHNQCNESSDAIEYPDLSKSDSSTVTRTIHTNTESGVEVCLFRIHGAGHTEPSGKQQYSRAYLLFTGVQNRDIEMADEIARFFEGKSQVLKPAH